VVPTRAALPGARVAPMNQILGVPGVSGARVEHVDARDHRGTRLGSDPIWAVGRAVFSATATVRSSSDRFEPSPKEPCVVLVQHLERDRKIRLPLEDSNLDYLIQSAGPRATKTDKLTGSGVPTSIGALSV